MSILTDADLKRLTVAQLKAICKDKRISGYSKLPKDGIIAKLLDWQKRHGVPNIVSNTQGQAASAVPGNELGSAPLLGASVLASNSPTTTSAANKTINIEHMAQITPVVSKDTMQIPSQQNNLEARGQQTLHRQNLESAQNLELQPSQNADNTVIPSSIGSVLNAAIKRKSSCDALSVSGEKKARLDAASSKPGTSRTQAVQSVPSSRVLQGSATKSTGTTYSQLEDPGSHPSARNSNLITASVSKTATNLRPTALVSKPFKALIPKRIIVQPLAKSKVYPMTFTTGRTLTGRTFGSLSGLEAVRDDDTVALGPISHPPSVSQRRRVPILALLLSGISLEDLLHCSLVSRAFRYSGRLISITKSNVIIMTISL